MKSLLANILMIKTKKEDKQEKKSFNARDKFFLLMTLIALLIVGIEKIIPDKKVEENKGVISIKLGKATLKAEVAKTQRELYLGLGKRVSLGGNQGMLFIHNGEDRYKYVMRDMNFDLDFIFIKNDKVVDIAKKVKREFSGVVQGATNYDKVLEVKAGWTEEHNIQLGDKIKIQE